MLRPLLVSCLCVSSCISRPPINWPNSTSLTNSSSGSSGNWPPFNWPNSTSLTNSSSGSSGNWWDTLASPLTSLDFNDFRTPPINWPNSTSLTNSSSGSTGNWWDTFRTYVPTNVKKFVYDTYEDGKDIAYDLYEDIHEEVVAKTQSNVDDFSKFIENLIREVESIQAEERKLWLQKEPLSEEQLEKKDKEIAESKKKLRDLADKIKEEMSKDEENKEPLERAIQQFITYIRLIISSEFYSTEYIWSKVRQVEGISYKALEILAKSTNEIKGLINDLFEQLSTVDISILGNRKRNETRETPRNIPN